MADAQNSAMQAVANQRNVAEALYRARRSVNEGYNVDRSSITNADLRLVLMRLDASAATPAPSDSAGWRGIETAPKDGTIIDLWVDGGRHTNAYWGRPHHTCGEAGRYCDCCPSYDAWVCADLNHYLTGEEGYAEEPTHWMPQPAAPAPEITS